MKLNRGIQRILDRAPALDKDPAPGDGAGPERMETPMQTTTVTISSATLARIEKTAILPFDDSGVVWRDDGMCDVPVSADLAERIERNRFPGETVDDCMSRILSIVGGSVQ